MVYKNDFVAIISVNGKILREQNGSVELPFGSDYSIRLKNLESRKARVKVSIDGKDVLNGDSLLLAPNAGMILEGFLDGNTVRERFRFIQKTQEIVDHRGDRLDDGIVRVEYCFEQRKLEYVPVYHGPRYDWQWTYPPTPRPVRGRYPFTYQHKNTAGDSSDWQTVNNTAGDPTAGDSIITNTCYAGDITDDSANLSADDQISFTSTPQANEGITVPGGETSQHFSNGYIGTTDAPHVITIRLRGVAGSGTAVKQVVGTRDKIKCSVCGRSWNARQHFCGNCGSNLGH